MSSEAVGWTFRHSPLKGADLAVHLAIADSVNDQNDNELWMAQSNLAVKARVSRQRANEAIGKLVDAGLLEVIEQHRGKRSRFRFLMPATVRPVYGPGSEPVADDDTSEGSHLSQGATPPVANDDTTCRHPRQDLSSTATPTTQENPSGSQGEHTPQPPAVLDLVAEQAPPPAECDHDGDCEHFVAFWTRYPHRVGRGQARRALRRALKLAALDEILEGLDGWCAFWAASGTERRFMPHPTTWLNGERWRDVPEPTRPAGTRAAAEAQTRAAADALRARFETKEITSGIA